DESFQRAQTTRGALVLKKVAPTSVAVGQEGGRQVILRLTKNDDLVRCFTLLSGDRAAVGGNFGRIYLFDTRTGALLRNFKGNSSDVSALASSPDGRYLLSAADQTLRIWDPNRTEAL